MKFASLIKIVSLSMLLTLGACAQPDSDTVTAAATAKLDLSKEPNKVTADDYALQPVKPGDAPLASVNAEGKVAPFGMASRAKRDVKAAPVMPVAATPASASTSAVFAANCIACHGADAKGVQGLGLDLTASKLVADSSPEELTEFLKTGRLPTDPASVTGVPMPAFAWMDNADLQEVVSFLKSL